jgi:hypothetical protein
LAYTENGIRFVLHVYEGAADKQPIARHIAKYGLDTTWAYCPIAQLSPRLCVRAAAERQHG